MTKIRWAALSVVFVLAASCGSAPTTGVRASDDAKHVVQEFVDAMRRGDFAGALALRCSAAAPSIDKARYKADLDRLTAILGAIRSVDVSIVETKIIPIAALPGRIDVSYRLVTTRGVHEPLLAVTSVENGKRVLCGWGTSEASRLFPDHIIGSGPPTSILPRALLDVGGPPSGVATEDAALQRNTSDPGQLDGWTRAWRLGSYGGARISALRYVGPDSALSAAADHLKRLQGNGVEDFKVPGVSSAVGIRIVEFSDLALQDGLTPPFIDEVYAAFGNTLINVGVSNLSTSGHEVAITLMQEIAARAKP